VTALAACALATAASADVQKKPPPLSVWVGEYTCSQGITAVRLALDIRYGAVEASFQFGPHPDNPTVQSGEVAMKGEVTVLARGGFRLHLVPDHWVKRPDERWQMVGLTAESDVAQRVLEGRIDDARCGEIRVMREE
jgi:hypothetical protein